MGSCLVTHVWLGYAYLFYSLTALSVFDFITCCFIWLNNTAYPSKFYETSQAHTFAFQVRDQRFAATVGSAQVHPIQI